MLQHSTSRQKKSILFSLALCVLMLASLLTSYAVTPTQRMADSRPALNLDALIPMNIEDWEEDRTLNTAVVNPQTEAVLKKVYAQTLSRTYVNHRGDRVMLSIAYGKDQGGESTQTHRPEICYTAQGFSLKDNHIDTLKTANGNIPVRRLVAVNGMRNEPLTYWVTVGDTATLPGLSRKLTQLSYGLNGTIPDGLIFRVSTIQKDAANAYELQDRFVNALFASITPDQQIRLAGRLDRLDGKS